MTAHQLWKRGYKDLVAVIPPDATLSRFSRIKDTQLGKIPGKLGKLGWHGYAFIEAPRPSEEEVQQWDSWGANTGILAASFPGLDVDSDDADTVSWVRDLALGFFGAAPERTSRGSRALFMYRAAKPFSRVALIARNGEEQHLVEMLGTGRQYLVSGRHPSGVEYGWRTALPKPNKLTLIDAEKVEDFFDLLAAEFITRGYNVERIGRTEIADVPVQAGLLAPSLDALERAVRDVPNDSRFKDRADYIKFGIAIKAAGQEDDEAAFAIFAEWASRWEDGKNNEEIVRQDWDSFVPPYRLGWNWIVEHVMEGGDFSSAQQEFEVLAPAGPEEPEETLATFMLVSDLAARPDLLEPPEAVIPNLAYRGRLVMLAGADKMGKSTLLAHAAAALSVGEPFLNSALEVGRTLWLGLEEAVGDSIRRFTDLRADGGRIMHVTSRPKDLLKQASKLLQVWPADLVVVDSLQEFARVSLGVAPDDGSNAAWANVVRPLVEFARVNDIAMVILHHVRRSDGQYRGAGEVAAAADALLEMRGPNTHEDARIRRITGRGRWQVLPMAIALRDGVYEVVAAIEMDLDERLFRAVEDEPGITVTDLRKKVGGKKATVVDAVKRLVDMGVLEDRGSDRKSSLYPGNAALEFVASMNAIPDSEE